MASKIKLSGVLFCSFKRDGEKMNDTQKWILVVVIFVVAIVVFLKRMGAF